MQFSAITLFCDDIREEKSGMDTIVGVYPGRIEASNFPLVLPKLSIYTRINLNIDEDIDQITIHMLTPEGRSELTRIDKNLIQNANDSAKSQGSPLAGLVTKATSSPFVIPKAGQVQIVVSILGEDYISGFLSIHETA